MRISGTPLHRERDDRGCTLGEIGKDIEFRLRGLRVIGEREVVDSVNQMAIAQTVANVDESSLA